MKRMDVSAAEQMPALLTVNEAAAALRLSRSTVYVLIRNGRLRSVKEGASRRVPAAAIGAYVRSLR